MPKYGLGPAHFEHEHGSCTYYIRAMLKPVEKSPVIVIWWATPRAENDEPCTIFRLHPTGKSNLTAGCPGAAATIPLSRQPVIPIER